MKKTNHSGQGSTVYASSEELPQVKIFDLQNNFPTTYLMFLFLTYHFLFF